MASTMAFTRSWKKKGEREFIEWQSKGTGMVFVKDETPIPDLPTDAELDKVVLAAGFTHCENIPYRHLRVVS